MSLLLEARIRLKKLEVGGIFLLIQVHRPPIILANVDPAPITLYHKNRSSLVSSDCLLPAENTLCRQKSTVKSEFQINDG